MLYELYDVAKLMPITAITGHYGAGKTNLAINLALEAAAAGREVAVVDLDVVNPYFRSSDYRELLESHGIRLVAPNLAGSTLDGPSISGEITTVIQWAQDDVFGNGNKRLALLDAGGDDVGATLLGRFSDAIKTHPYDMLYVVNAKRNLTQSPEEAVEVLREIEHKCRLRATAVVSNTHLQDATDEQVVEQGLVYAERVASLTGLPAPFTAVPEALVQKTGNAQPEGPLVSALPVRRYVRTPWE